MTQELKACPFCGGEAEIDEIAGGIGALFFASCKDDDCCGYRIDPWVKHSRRIEAAQHWNTRTPDSVIAELADELAFIATFAAMRSQDDSKTFARVNRGALRTISAKANAALAKLEASK